MPFIRLAAAITLAVVAIAGDTRAQAKAANPLQSVSRSIGGIWVEADELENPDGKYLKTMAEWGVNNKLVRSFVWQVSGDTETLVFEGGYYWHPGEKKVAMWAVATGGAFMEGTVKVEGDVQTTAWKMFSDRAISGENRARYTDDDTIVTDEYFDGPQGLQKYRTLRMVRKPADWKPAADKDGDEKPDAPEAKPSSLDESAKMVGGKWVTEKGVKNPKAEYNYFRVDWGVDRKVLRSTTWMVRRGKPVQLYEGAQYWHPERKELVFFEVSREGELYLGTITQQDGKQVSRWTAYSARGEDVYEQRVQFKDDDTIASQVLVKRGDTMKPMLDFTFIRKADNWPDEAAEDPSGN